MPDAVLEIIGVSKRFGALAASRDVSLDLRPGEIHALIGPNGAGKSTLIKQIAGELRPDSGAIRFNGEPIDHLGPEARARLGLARTFQISSLVPEMPVLRNVMLAVIGRTGAAFRFLAPAGRDKAVREEALACLVRVDLAGASDTPVAELSHGQRRRLEMAMALALKPRAFLLDEPMAGLGADGSAELVGLLANLKREAPILLIEHDMDAVFTLADRISVLVYGEIIATGDAQSIRADVRVRTAYLGDEA
ncbi:MAG: ABC transporter ATP-binding protein [Rhizobiaceae bacterium]